MNQPINDCRKLNECEKRDGEFLVSGAEAPVTFETTEEVFDSMAPPVVAAVKGHWPTAKASRRDTDPRTLCAKARANRVGIETSIGDSAAVAQAGQEPFDSVKIVTLALGQAERHGSPTSLNNRGKPRIDSTFGATNRLGSLAAARVLTVLMPFDVRAIDMPQLTCGSCRDHRKHPGEESLGTPATKPRIDRSPRAKLLWQIAPRDTRSQDAEYRVVHKPIIFRRSPAQRPPAGLFTRAVNNSSLRHNGTGSSQRRISFMRQVGLTRLVFVPTPFLNN
jgi:hypothetical protein